MLLARFPPVVSGAGRQALTLAKALRQNGVQTFVVTSGTTNTSRFEYVEGVPVHRVGAIGSGRLWAYCWAFLLLGLLFRKRAEYDILHIHGANIWAIPSALFARLSGKRIVVKITGYGQDDPVHLARETFGSFKCRLFKWADITISISSLITESYKSMAFPKAKLHRIPNCVDVNRFAPSVNHDEKMRLRESLGLANDRTLLLNTGNVREAKGIDTLIRAWDLAIADLNQASLLLVGSCDEEPEFVNWLEGYVEDRGLTDSVVITGYVNNVEEYLRAADLYVFPSRREGLPNALLEALSVGLPCIALDIPQIIEDIISNGEDGVVVYKSDPVSLSREIIALVGNHSLREFYGKRARAKIMNEFSTDVVVKKYITLYSRLRDI